MSLITINNKLILTPNGSFVQNGGIIPPPPPGYPYYILKMINSQGVTTNAFDTIKINDSYNMQDYISNIYYYDKYRKYTVDESTIDRLCNGTSYGETFYGDIVEIILNSMDDFDYNFSVTIHTSWNSWKGNIELYGGSAEDDYSNLLKTEYFNVPNYSDLTFTNP